jgi:hypothetical protein
VSRPLELVIEALVLEGFDPASRTAIAASTVEALTALLREQDLVLQTGNAPRLVAQPIQLSSLSSPRAIGEGIARAVHAALPGSAPTGARG